MTTLTRKAATVLILASWFSDCGAAAASNQAKWQTVSLAFQEQASLPGSKLNVHFVGYRDSRCPSNVQCAWSGEAHAFFWVSGEGLKPQVVTVPWDGSVQSKKHSQRVGTFYFYLQSLDPRPLQGGRVEPTDYKAVLQITR